jgi:hypothetical protein
MWTLPVAPAGRLKDQTFRTPRSIVSSEIYGLTLKASYRPGFRRAIGLHADQTDFTQEVHR